MYIGVAREVPLHVAHPFDHICAGAHHNIAKLGHLSLHVVHFEVAMVIQYEFIGESAT